jgi:hypothetical protein
MVNEEPEQMLPLFTAMVGDGVTETCETAVFVETQPAALEPATE